MNHHNECFHDHTKSQKRLSSIKQLGPFLNCLLSHHFPVSLPVTLSPQWCGQLPCQMWMPTWAVNRGQKEVIPARLWPCSRGKHCGGWVHGVPWRDGGVEKHAVPLLSPLNSSGFYITYPPSVPGCQLQRRTDLLLSWKINQHAIADANIHTACPCSADCFGAPTGHRRNFLIVPTVCHMVCRYLGLQMASFVAFSL